MISKSLARNLFLSTILFSLAGLLSCQKITDVMRPFMLSEDQEVELGDQFKDQILSDTENYPPYNGSQKVIDFVDSLGQHLASVQTDRSDLKFTFTIIDDDEQVNAFAIPGGHVFVYTGLLKNMNNTSELAGVLAHEIGHITQYHGADKMVQGNALELVNTIFFNGSDSASITSAIAGLLENMVFLSFSRKDEFEADSCALAYSINAKISPEGMKDFLAFLKSEYGDQPKIFEPMSTHPLLSDRINKINAIISKSSDVPDDMYENEYLKIKGLI